MRWSVTIALVLLAVVLLTGCVQTGNAPGPGDPPFFRDDFENTQFLTSLDQVVQEGSILRPTGTTTGGEINPSSPIGNGLLGLWHLNGNFLDNSGRNQDGTASGISFVTGRFNQGASFTTGQNQIRLGAFDELENSRQFSLSVWVNPSTVTQDTYYILDKSGAGTDTFTLLWHPNQDVYFTIYNTSNQAVSARFSDAITRPNQWYHIVAIVDGSRARDNVMVYVNGVLGSTKGTLTGNTATTNNHLRAGRDQSSWKGIMDEIAVWNRALTEAEVQELYRGSGGGTTGRFVSTTISLNNVYRRLRATWSETTAGATQLEFSGTNGNGWCNLPNGQWVSNADCVQVPFQHIIYRGSFSQDTRLDWVQLEWDDAVINNCGNGILQAEEECDDGDQQNGDGCSATCTVETDWTCVTGPSECEVPRPCGASDGVCPTNCTNPPDADCPVTPFCGNNIQEGAEECDDGCLQGTPNVCEPADNGDGCSSECRIEETIACGDGAIEGNESCDDNNTNSNDGCSASCAIEDGWTCTGQPSICTQNPTCDPTDGICPTGCTNPPDTDCPTVPSGNIIYADNRLTQPSCNTYNVQARSCSGGSETAFKEIQAAVNTLSADKTLYIRGGTYQKPVGDTCSARGGDCFITVCNSTNNDRQACTIRGTAAQPIRIEGYPGERPLLKGNGTYGVNGDTEILLYIAESPTPGSDVNYVQVRNLEISDARGASREAGFGIYTFGHHGVIENVIVHHNNGANITVAGRYNLIQNNEIYKACWQSGILIRKPGEYNLIKDNLVYENGVWTAADQAACIAAGQSADYCTRPRTCGRNSDGSPYVADGVQLNHGNCRYATAPETCEFNEIRGNYIGFNTEDAIDFANNDLLIIDNIMENNHPTGIPHVGETITLHEWELFRRITFARNVIVDGYSGWSETPGPRENTPSPSSKIINNLFFRMGGKGINQHQGVFTCSNVTFANGNLDQLISDTAHSCGTDAWQTQENGPDPGLANANYRINRNFPVGMSITEKLQNIKNQVQQNFSPGAGSSLTNTGRDVSFVNPRTGQTETIGHNEKGPFEYSGGTGGGTQVFIDNHLNTACPNNYSIVGRNCSGGDGTAYPSLDGVSTVSPGTIVYMRAGTYTKTGGSTSNPMYTIAWQGSAASPIELKPYNNETVVLDAQRQWQGPLKVSARFVTIDGLTFKRGHRYGLLAHSSQDVTIKNSTALNTSGYGNDLYGFWATYSERVTFDGVFAFAINSPVTGNDGLGIQLGDDIAASSLGQAACKQCVVQNSVVYGVFSDNPSDNRSDAIVAVQADGCVIRNNVVANVDDDGIDFSTIGCRIENNAVLFARSNGLKQRLAGGANVIQNNIVAFNGGIGVNVQTSSGPNMFLQNVIFKNNSLGWSLTGQLGAVIFNNLSYNNKPSESNPVERDIQACRGSYTTCFLQSNNNWIGEPRDLQTLRSSYQMDATSLSGNPLLRNTDWGNGNALGAAAWSTLDRDQNGLVELTELLPGIRDLTGDNRVNGLDGLIFLRDRFGLQSGSSAINRGAEHSIVTGLWNSSANRQAWVDDTNQVLNRTDNSGTNAKRRLVLERLLVYVTAWKNNQIPTCMNCITNLETILATVTERDASNQARQGTAWDMGAYESG